MTYELHVVSDMAKPWSQFLALRDFWGAQKNIKPFSSKIKQSASAREALMRAVPSTTPSGERDHAATGAAPSVPVAAPSFEDLLAQSVAVATSVERHLSVVPDNAVNTIDVSPVVVKGITLTDEDRAEVRNEQADEWLRTRITKLSKPALEALGARWRTDLIAPPGQHPEPYTADEIDAICQLLDLIEAEYTEPFPANDPRLPAAPPPEEWTERAAPIERPDEGDLMHIDKVAHLVSAAQALTTSQQAFIEDVCARALKHGYSMNMSAGATRRQWLLARTLMWAVEIFDKETDTIAAALVGGDLGEWCAWSPIHDITIALHKLIELRAGKRALSFDGEGIPCFPLADPSNRVTLSDRQVAEMLEATA